jgi:hypothetical protein
VHHISQRKNCKEKRDDFLGSLLGPWFEEINKNLIKIWSKINFLAHSGR